MSKKKATSFRLSPEAEKIIKELAMKLGVTQAAIVEMAIREFEKKQGESK